MTVWPLQSRDTPSGRQGMWADQSNFLVEVIPAMSKQIPFPLTSGRYEVGPGMRRFGQAGQGFPAEQGDFCYDDDLAATLAAKLAVLQRAPQECHLAAGEDPGLEQALRETFALLALEHPDRFAVNTEGASIHHLGLRLIGWRSVEVTGTPWPGLGEVAPAIIAWLSGQKGLTLLGNTLGLSVQEDLAVVRGPADADTLEWLHVCLPSGWAPAEKSGRSFAAVHQPVAHSDQLMASAQQIVRAMIQGGPFVRYVWGIHRDEELCHNPRLHRSAPWPDDATPEQIARQAHFRVERQTTHGFPELNRALFTIRYWVSPFPEVAADPWQRDRLTSALAGMDELELDYKGLTSARDRLVAWLRS